MINKRSHIPVYMQIEEQLKKKIAEGIYKVGQVIPSERELALQYDVSRMTVRQAITNLVNDGLLYREKGRGTFVSSPKLEQPLNGLTSFTEDMLARGMVPSSQLVKFERKPAPFELAQDLLIESGEDVYSIMRIRNADGEPMAIERTYLPAKLFPGLTAEKLQTSLYSLIESHYQLTIGNAIQQMEAALTTKEDAQFLHIPPSGVVLLIKRTSFLDSGQPFEIDRSVYRADRYKFISEIQR